MRDIHKTLAAGLLSSAIAGTALGAGNNVDFSSVYVRPKPGNNADEIMAKDIKDCSTEASLGGIKSKQTILFKYRNCLINRDHKLLN